MDDTYVLEIMEENNHVIEKTVRSIIRNSSMVDDAVQEVKIKVYQHLVTERSSPNNVSSWISVVSRNAAYDELRKLQRNESKQSKLLQFTKLRQRSDQYGKSAEHDVLSRETLNEVRHLLSEFDEETQHILELRYRGASYKQIAKECHCSVPNVKSKLFRGKKKLVDLCVAKGVFNSEM
ncbi:RNA polymerase sigma factor [Guptibacillus spartinae]|uniref:RNA polymerase sigma factor n=1 Tax=Guptibacillus spartinae TaxID=3025679 RepID=UPI002360E7FF|nr:sigma-70 family RNA polymerase sigma factor [Pseudalkalibacillus spartinae]